MSAHLDGAFADWVAKLGRNPTWPEQLVWHERRRLAEAWPIEALDVVAVPPWRDVPIGDPLPHVGRARSSPRAIARTLAMLGWLVVRVSRRYDAVTLTLRHDDGSGIVVCTDIDADPILSAWWGRGGERAPAHGRTLRGLLEFATPAAPPAPAEPLTEREAVALVESTLGGRIVALKIDRGSDPAEFWVPERMSPRSWGHHLTLFHAWPVDQVMAASRLAGGLALAHGAAHLAGERMRRHEHAVDVLAAE